MALVDRQINQITRPLEHRLIKLDGTIGGVAAKILLDCGASHLYLNAKFVNAHPELVAAVVQTPDDERLTVTLADGTTKATEGDLKATRVVIGSYVSALDFTVTDLVSGYDAILGMSWLKAINPAVDWRAGTITISHGDKTHVLRASNADATHTVGLNLITTKQLQRQHRAGELQWATLVYSNAIHEAAAAELYSVDSPLSADSTADETDNEHR